jgi:ribosomal protein S18 acetylase RimI-like enzyme
VAMGTVEMGTVEIRAWQHGDARLAAATEPFLSASSLSHRFLAGTGGHLPTAYLRHIAGGARPEWDAQVAAGPGHLLGWSEFGRAPGEHDTADLAVLVADPWHRQGVASALIRAMLPRMAEAGVRTLHADVLPSNQAAQALLMSVFGRGLRYVYEDGVVRYRVPLNAAITAAALTGAVLTGPALTDAALTGPALTNATITKATSAVGIRAAGYDRA